jgi:hypothetical protein
MNWKHKANIFSILSRLPFGDLCLFQLQSRVTKQIPRSDLALAELIAAAKRIVHYFQSHSIQGINSETSFLEIGAGRDLAVAITLRMLGVQKVTCIDINKLARLELVQHAARYLATSLCKPLPIFNTWDDVEKFGITYMAPRDILDLPDTTSYSCFYSTDTLEHIPKEIIYSIFVL